MSWFSDLLGGDIVPDGQGGYVPADNSRYDPATGQFLDAATQAALMRLATAVPSTPVAQASALRAVAPAAPVARSVNLDDDSAPSVTASPASGAAPATSASPSVPVTFGPSALARAEAMPVNLPRYTDIKAPDGSIARFPASMTDADIVAVMKRHYPPPSNAPASGTAQQGGIGTADPYEAFSSTISDPYAAFASPVSQPTATAQQSGVLPAVASTLRAINEGIPFSDRIVAAAKSLPFVGNDQGYAANLAQEQAARGQLNQAHPLSTAFARGVGGVMTTAALPGFVAAEAGLAPCHGQGARVQGRPTGLHKAFPSSLI